MTDDDEALIRDISLPGETATGKLRLFEDIGRVLAPYRAAQRARGREIVFVTEDPHYRKLISTSLTYKGFTVSCLGSAAPLATYCKNQRPGLVLIDLDISEEMGSAIAKIIAQLDDTVPVLGLSSTPSTPPSGVQIDDVISKPFIPSELTRLLHQHMPTAAPHTHAKP